MENLDLSRLPRTMALTHAYRRCRRLGCLDRPNLNAAPCRKTESQRCVITSMSRNLRNWISRLAVLLVFAASTQVLAQRGRIARGSIASEGLKTNLFGDASIRPYAVYLPPSYDATTLRYPVIYVLHGYTDNENGLISTVQSTLDSQIAQRKIGELIAVFVNGSNRLKGAST
jgi:hypothetical protein